MVDIVLNNYSAVSRSSTRSREAEDVVYGRAVRKTLIALSAVVGCHASQHGQTFAEGVQALCDLPDHVPEPGQRYDQRLVAVQQWAEQHITNADAKKLGSLEGARTNPIALANAVKTTGIAHCKLLDNALELQSFADAMKIVCGAPKKGSPDYLVTHLLNSEIARTFATLDNMNPGEQIATMHALVKRAGLTECPALEPVAAGSSEQAPTLADEPGLEKLDSGSPILRATANAIDVERKPVIALRDGTVDPADLEGGAMGLLIPTLRAFLSRLSEQIYTGGRTDPDTGILTISENPAPLALVIDPKLSYGLLLSIVFTAKQAGFRDFAVVVHAGRDLKAIPLRLPHKAPPGAGRAGLKPVVSITKDHHMLLWSISGLEGTMQKPLVNLAPDETTALRKAVAAIVARRKTAGDEIIVMADQGIAMQTIAEVMAAVRTDEAGKPLFPTVLLSSGFE
jgi:biopolymer transport protein ExbD